MAGGRPSKYNVEYEKIAYRLSLLGLTDMQIAETLNVTEQTLNNWKRQHPQFFESLKKGKAPADAKVAESLLSRALGGKVVLQRPFKVKRVEYNERGQRIAEFEEIQYADYEENIPPDTGACCYWLNNRQSSLWRNKPEEKDTMDKLDKFLEAQEITIKDGV